MLRCEVQALVVPDWQQLYHGVLHQAQEVLLDTSDVMEKNLEVMRISRELRQWRIFFEKLGDPSEDETDDPRSKVLSNQIREIMFGTEDEDDESTD